MPENNQNGTPIPIHNLREAIYICQQVGNNDALQFYCDNMLQRVMPTAMGVFSQCHSTDEIMFMIAGLETVAMAMRSQLPDEDADKMINEIIKKAIRIEIASVRIPRPFNPQSEDSE